MDLDKVGDSLFGSKYIGTFASDQFLKLDPSDLVGKYAIINNKKLSHGGEHWIAAAWSDNKIYMFDTFGRPTNTLIPSVHSWLDKHTNVVDSDYDKNQLITQYDCGSRCMSFLYIFDTRGPECAVLI